MNQFGSIRSSTRRRNASVTAFDGNSCSSPAPRRPPPRIASFVLLDLARLAVLDEPVHDLADPGLVPGVAPEPELVAEHVLELAVLEVRQARVGQRAASRGAGGRCRSSRAGTTTARGSTPSASRPSSAASRARSRRDGSASVRRHDAGGLARPTPVRRTGPAGAGATATPQLVDEARCVADARRRRACGSLAASTTRRRARPRTMRNSRRSSSSRARFRSDRLIGPSSTARSNIGSGRARLGKFPSTAPATITVSNSRPAGAVRGQHLDGVGPRALRSAEQPGPCSPGVEGLEERCDARVARASLARRRRSRTSTTASSSRRPRATLGVGHEPRASRGAPPTGCGTRPAPTCPANSAGLRERRAGARRPRGLVGRQALGDARARRRDPQPGLRGAHQPARRRRREPDEVGGEQLLRPARRGGLVGDEPSQREHVRGAWRAPRSATARARERRAGPARRRAPAAARPRARPVGGPPRRARPTARPSSTCSRRSSRAIAACSSEVCGATQPSTSRALGGAVRRLELDDRARRRTARANRPSGTSVVPWNENTCASGSPATTRSGAPSPREQRLGGERRVLVVVDEQVVERAARRRPRPAAARCTSAGEVDRRSGRRAPPGTRAGTGRARASR